MSVIGWIRDLFGIQKDMYDTKRTRLEIKKLESAEREKLITPATFEDVKKYDPKVQKLITLERARLEIERLWIERRGRIGHRPFFIPALYLLIREGWFWVWVIIFLILVVITYLLLR